MKKKMNIQPWSTPDTKDRLLDTPVTLNGKPAKIVGRLLPFPTVRTIDGRISGQWSWHAAERIVAQGGNFTL